MNHQPHPASYRDPAGYVFLREGVLYRQVNKVYRNDYQQLMRGLYDHLESQGFLIAHEELEQNLTGDPDWHITLKPEPLPFISHPCEWTFGMLKDAARLTLNIMEEALEAGMILKDASAFNVQWRGVHEVFIDTLSFERYDPAKPWIAYRQFCEQFLAPLALMHYTGQPIQPMLVGFPEGIPLQLARQLLPAKSRWSVHAWLHLHLHGKVAAKKGSTSAPSAFSEKKLRQLLRSLREFVSAMQWKANTVWSGYYEEASERDGYLEAKTALVGSWLEALGPLGLGIDLGANEGRFSRLLARQCSYVLATDFDAGALERLYQEFRQRGNEKITPLLLDLSNPTPAFGVNNRERASFLQRAKGELVLALALVHHLCIGKNMQFDQVADFMAGVGKRLLIEWVPKEDPKVQVLLQGKKDIYEQYTNEAFEAAFG